MKQPAALTWSGCKVACCSSCLIVIENHHRSSGLTQTSSSAGEQSEAGVMGLKSKGHHGCLSSGGSGNGLISLSLPASRGHPQSSAHSPLLPSSEPTRDGGGLFPLHHSDPTFRHPFRKFRNGNPMGIHYHQDA